MLTPNPYLHYRIAACRERLGLSQSELAELVGKTERYIELLEQGEKKHPDTLMLAGIAAALDVTLEDLNRKERYLWRISVGS